MWNSRDIALVIVFAVSAFVYQGIAGQIPLIITGIPGIGYFFAIGGVIIFGTAFLMFEGKRWMFFVFSVLYALLMSMIFVNLGSFHIFRGIPMIIAGFIQDVVFNTAYGPFERQNRLKLLAILQTTLGGSILDTFLRFLIFPLLMPSQATTVFISTVSMMFPLILLYGIIGGYIAYLIYSRVKRPRSLGSISY